MGIPRDWTASIREAKPEAEADVQQLLSDRPDTQQPVDVFDFSKE